MSGSDDWLPIGLNPNCIIIVVKSSVILMALFIGKGVPRIEKEILDPIIIIIIIGVYVYENDYYYTHV